MTNEDIFKNADADILRNADEATRKADKSFDIVSDSELENIAGGGMPGQEYEKKWVNVQESYLALRNACAFAYENEIGKLWNGDYVLVTGIDWRNSGTYVWCYAPSLGLSGYVNKNFLR